MVSQQRRDCDIPIVTLTLPLVRLDQGRFSFSLPLLQSQKRFLATSANKAFEINHPARCSPLLRSDVGVLAKPDIKTDKTFALPNLSICKFDVTTSDAILTFSIIEYIL